MYKELYDSLPNVEWVSLGDPASRDDISSVAQELGVHLPDDLYEFYCETDGDGCAIFPLSRMVPENRDLRRMANGMYMPLDCLLFFADNGCGDYFGYPIIGGEAEQQRIYMWNHDTDERLLVANTLEEFISLYYGDEAAGNEALGTRM